MTEVPGSPDFFGRIPLFRELARLLSGGSSPINWELARQVAVATAAGPETAGLFGIGSPVSASQSMTWTRDEVSSWESFLDLGELWIEPTTGLPALSHPLRPKLSGASDWAESLLPSFAPLLEPRARRLSDPAAGALPAELMQMATQFGALLHGLQAGTSVGQLARGALTQADLLLPPVDDRHIAVLGRNVDAFASQANLPKMDLQMWLGAHTVLHARLMLGVRWVGEYLSGLVDEIALHTAADAQGMLERLQTMDPSQPERVRELLEGDNGLLQMQRGPGGDAAAARLEALLAITSGFLRVTVAQATAGRLPGLQAIESALHERDVDSEQPGSVYAQLLGVDPALAAPSRGEAFCREVLAATDNVGLERIWQHPDFLPSPAELVAPGRWLERVGLLGGADIDLDAGLESLLSEADRSNDADTAQSAHAPEVRTNDPSRADTPGSSFLSSGQAPAPTSPEGDQGEVDGKETPPSPGSRGEEDRSPEDLPGTSGHGEAGEPD